MNKVYVYDIAADKVYLQPATGTMPSPRMWICAVVASAADNSSHQVCSWSPAATRESSVLICWPDPRVRRPSAGRHGHGGHRRQLLHPVSPTVHLDARALAAAADHGLAL